MQRPSLHLEQKRKERLLPLDIPQNFLSFDPASKMVAGVRRALSPEDGVKMVAGARNHLGDINAEKVVVLMRSNLSVMN